MGPKSPTRTFQNVKKVFVDWSKNVAFQSYPKIFDDELHFLVKFLWLLVFLVFSGITSYLCVQSILVYLQWGIVSTIEIIRESPTEFPAVTICNANPFTTKTAQKLISNITILSFGKDIDQFTTDQVLQNFTDVYEMTKMLVSSKNYGEMSKQLLSLPLDIIKCSFNNKPCSTNSDFTWYYHYVYGNCLQFNTGANASLVRKTKTEGPIHGLSLILYVPESQCLYPNLDGHGLKLFIHNKTFGPRINELINIKAGFSTNVAIEKTISYKTPHPYSACQDLTTHTSVYRSALKSANKPYRQYDCIKLCLQRHLIDKCECFWTRYLTFDKSIQPCLNLTQMYCINEQLNEFIITEECLGQCPLECETVTFNVQTSSLDYPSQSLYSYLLNNSEYKDSFKNRTGRNYSMETISACLVSLNIFFPFTQYTEISQEPKLHVFELVSQIGGSMGMLVGFSIFHLLELFEILLLVLFTLFND